VGTPILLVPTTPVIISDKLSEYETQQLVIILERHRSVIGYSLEDLKGISPALCTHHIPIDPNFTPSREPQRRLNNAMREVVKKEVLKLYQAGIIYPVPHSKWVSPVQVVPKKGGMTVVRNEKNELIPQPIVTEWRMCMTIKNSTRLQRKTTSRYPSLIKCWNGLQTTLSFVSLMAILDITKSRSTQMIKIRLLSHAHMELMHTDKYHLGYAMLQLLSNGA
jgi:hypothetical protein